MGFGETCQFRYWRCLLFWYICRLRITHIYLKGKVWKIPTINCGPVFNARLLYDSQDSVQAFLTFLFVIFLFVSIFNKKRFPYPLLYNLPHKTLDSAICGKSNKINFPILDSLVVTRFIYFLRVFSVVKKLIEVSIQYLLSNIG